MKYIYIAGMEHSGTTVVSHMISQKPNYLALGEVASFFSEPHMKNYMKLWGEYSDVNLCSCGQAWEDCSFWSNIMHLSGLNSSAPVEKKYQLLFLHCKTTFPSDTVFIDSSKSLSTLRLLLEGLTDCEPESISVVFAVKDVRNFATSIASKVGTKSSLLSTWRSFNWWLGTNLEMLKYLQESNINFTINLYDQFCLEPDLYVSNQLKKLGHDSIGISADRLAHQNSHIAMGNKDFTSRNRDKITYDSRWEKNRNARVVYALHRKAREFNEYLHKHHIDSHE